jgi:hypothetical protein
MTTRSDLRDHLAFRQAGRSRIHRRKVHQPSRFDGLFNLSNLLVRLDGTHRDDRSGKRFADVLMDHRTG